jgi:hypothetical protein
MKLKIWYKPLDRTSNIEHAELLESVVRNLKGNRYEIICQTTNCVQFKYDYWRPGSRMTALSFLNGGKLDIIDETKTIRLSYYLSPMHEVVIVCLAAVLAIFVGPPPFYLFGAFFSIGFGIRAAVVTSTANELMDQIMNGNTGEGAP